MDYKNFFKDYGIDILLLLAALLMGGAFFMSETPARLWVAALLGLFIIMFLKSVFSCSGPAATVTEWIGRFSRGDSVDLRAGIDVPGGSKLGGVAKAFNAFVGAMRGYFLRIMQGLHRFTFNFYHLDRQLGEFFEAFDAMSGGVKEGVAAGRQVSHATEAQYASSEEISATAQGLAHLAAELNEAVAAVSERADAGNRGLREVGDSFASMADGMEVLSGEARILSGKADVIQSVVHTITGIADQTNLLALNASIEAARAGEAGRGFAVVAEEVRKLAEESKNAAEAISANLQELVSGVRNTSGGVESAAAKMNEAHETVESVLSEIGAVLNGIGGISDSSERVAASAQELGASSEELAASAETVTRETERMGSAFSSIEERIALLSHTAAGLKKTSTDGAGEASELVKGLSVLKAMKPEDFIVIAEDAVKAHNLWVENLRGYVGGGRWDLETDPKRCQFGIFLSFIERPEGAPEALWRDILAMHDKLHGMGHSVRDAAEAGDGGRARTLFKEVEALSGRLSASLQQVAEICRAQAGQEGPRGLVPLS
ncbi:MAG: methyl-accepting chemotaxis protein [Aminivibrio sp.]|jgi:methyl-accepting chemotaxis protein